MSEELSKFSFHNDTLAESSILCLSQWHTDMTVSQRRQIKARESAHQTTGNANYVVFVETSLEEGN